MNKINALFKKDSVIKIISVLIAVFIWFLVLDKENPFEERNMSIPLSSNLQVLQSNNLQLIGSPLPATIDIKIKGRSDHVTAVTVNDFKAYIDLSDIITSGTKKINVNAPEYLGDKDIFITSVNPSSITLNFERIVGKQYPVNVEFKGTLPANYELVNFTVDPSNVILEELESSISQVEKVVAYVNLDDISDNTEIIMRGTALNSDGEVIKQFEGKIPIIVKYDLAKRVPIVATTKGVPTEDFYLKEIRYSHPQIRVLGSKSVLDGISRIETEPINISEMSASFSTPLALILPNDVTALEEDVESLTAEVVVERLSTRSINVPASQISIYEGDMTGSKSYRVSEGPITIVIKGKPDTINAVKGTDVSLSVQVDGFEIGEHEVPLNVRLPNNVTLVGEYTVNITIEEVEDVTPTPNSP